MPIRVQRRRGGLAVPGRPWEEDAVEHAIAIKPGASTELSPGQETDVKIAKLTNDSSAPLPEG